jgi:hypothetical protein
MQRIQGDFATEDNFFTEGNPAAGVPATLVKADWLNGVQEELVNVVVGGGLTLDGGDNTQLLTAIQALIAAGGDSLSAVRDAWAGMIVEWESETIPLLDDGLPKGLELDGSIVSLATYPRLLAKYCGDASNADAPAWYRCTDTGTRNTAGAYMRLQDRRGEFARGWDHGREVDTDRVLGSWQADDLAAHDHSLHNIALTKLSTGQSWAATSITDGDSVMTNETGGLETRPRNIATMYIVLI